MTPDAPTTELRGRRDVLLGSAMATVAALATSPQASSTETAISKSASGRIGRSVPNSSNTLLLKDGTELYYKDWGSGPVVTFSHGWPLSADAWDAQLVFLSERGYRVVAHDRRGHGRSSQTWSGNDMDTYADDLAALMDHLDLSGATMVGHSTGGGEVARYVGRHGMKRVSKVVLVAAVPPWMLKSKDNPYGAPMDVFDGLRAGVRAERSQFFKELSAPFFGANLPDAKPWQGLREWFWLQSMMAGHKAIIDCIKAFSETNFTADLEKIDCRTLLIHGEADQIVPIQIASERTVKIVKNAKLKVYPGAPHGLPMTHQDTFNQDLLDFIKA